MRNKLFGESYLIDINQSNMMSYIASNFCPSGLGLKNFKKSCSEKNCVSCWKAALNRHARENNRGIYG